MKKIKSSTIIILSILILLSSSCASIVSKSTYLVNITSSPSGANVTVQNDQGREINKGVTPATFTLDASDGYFDAANYTILLEKDGYLSQTLPLNPTIDMWYALGNFGSGFLLGWLLVDPASGAMWKLNEGVHANLYPTE